MRNSPAPCWVLLTKCQELHSCGKSNTYRKHRDTPHSTEFKEFFFADSFRFSSSQYHSHVNVPVDFNKNGHMLICFNDLILYVLCQVLTLAVLCHDVSLCKWSSEPALESHKIDRSRNQIWEYNKFKLSQQEGWQVIMYVPFDQGPVLGSNYLFFFPSSIFRKTFIVNLFLKRTHFFSSALTKYKLHKRCI